MSTCVVLGSCYVHLCCITVVLSPLVLSYGHVLTICVVLGPRKWFDNWCHVWRTSVV